MKLLEQVKVYNARRLQDYNDACKAWEPSKGGFPYIGFYLFYNGDHERRQRGWIVTDGNSHMWFPNREKAEAKFQEVIA